MSCNDGHCCDSKHKHEDIDGQLKRRPRSPTLLNLSWLRDRLGKMAQIKEKLQSGAYQVNSEDLAKSVLNKE